MPSPSSKDSFRGSSSFNTFSAIGSSSNMSVRLGPFTSNQIMRLHEFHSEMHMTKGICCVMSFDYGHNYARASYQLTSPIAEGRDIIVALTEERKSSNNFSYSVRCEIDGIKHSDHVVVSNVITRNDIPEYVLSWARLQMQDLGTKAFIGMPSPKGDPSDIKFLNDREP